MLGHNARHIDSIAKGVEPLAPSGVPAAELYGEAVWAIWTEIALLCRAGKRWALSFFGAGDLRVNRA